MLEIIFIFISKNKEIYLKKKQGKGLFKITLKKSGKSIKQQLK